MEVSLEFDLTSFLTIFFYRAGHVSDQVNRLILQCTDNRGVTAKRQRRFAKYRQQINECGDDINALSRFIGAQRIAFAKILKKYKVG